MTSIYPIYIVLKLYKNSCLISTTFSIILIFLCVFFFFRFVNNVTELGQTKVHRMPLHRIADSVCQLSTVYNCRFLVKPGELMHKIARNTSRQFQNLTFFFRTDVN